MNLKFDAVINFIGRTTKEINLFFENWYEHTELTRLETIRSLRTAGSLSAKYKIEMTEDFKCPLFGFNLIKPCSLTSCQYYVYVTNNTQQIQVAHNCKNCLINCLDLSKNNRMSAHEVAAILGISVSEVNNCNASAVSKVRRQKIKENLEKYQIPRFEYLDGHCISCEQYIKDELEMNLWPELIIQPNRHGWCSLGCKENKPKWQFLIEKEFSCNYLDAMAVGYLLYKNVESLGGIFSVNKDILVSYKDSIQENFDFLKTTFG